MLKASLTFVCPVCNISFKINFAAKTCKLNTESHIKTVRWISFRHGLLNTMKKQDFETEYFKKMKEALQKMYEKLTSCSWHNDKNNSDDDDDNNNNNSNNNK